MKPVKPVNTKSKSPTRPIVGCTHTGERNGWHKFQFYFRTIEACNLIALQLAALLRKRWPKVYYARYTNSLESRLDIYVWFPPNTDITDITLTPVELNQIVSAQKSNRWHKVVGPTPCEGSDVHAAGFDFVLQFVGHCLDRKMESAQIMVLWNDTLHWMHNMAGYDYTDEAKCHLHTLSTIIQVFADSIALGNKMSKVARRSHKPKNLSRN